VDQTLWLPGTRDRALAKVIEVPAGGTASVGVRVEVASAVVKGRVIGSWQTLQDSWPMVTLVAADSSEDLAASFRVKEDGSFEARILDPVPAKLLVDINGSRRWYGGSSFSDAEVLPLQEGAELPQVEVVESGLLLDLREPTYQDISRASVQLIDPATLRVVHSARIDIRESNPFHAISNLAPGDYLLRILADQFLRQNWLEQWYDRAPGPETAMVVTIPSNGGVGSAKVELQEGGRIAGTIWYDDRRSSGVLVYITSADDPVAIGRMHPGEDCYCGVVMIRSPYSYALRGLPAGSYKVGVWRLSFGASWEWPDSPPPGTSWYPQEIDWSRAEVIDISGAGETPDIDFDLR
jgi:hypothetical protein